MNHNYSAFFEKDAGSDAGKMVFIPNHTVMNGQVVNSSLRHNRHLDIDFFIPYDQNVEQVQKIVGEILKEDEHVLEEPSPRVVIAQFSPNYLEMQARFWVLRKDTLTGKWGLNAKIKSKFDGKIHVILGNWFFVAYTKQSLNPTH